MLMPESITGGVLLPWFILTGAALVFLIYDLETNTPSMWVMKLAWILIVLYGGPLGLFIYLLSCRQPMPGTHDQFIASHWKQSVGSLMHCVAGDATGLILGDNADEDTGRGRPQGTLVLRNIVRCNNSRGNSRISDKLMACRERTQARHDDSDIEQARYARNVWPRTQRTSGFYSKKTRRAPSIHRLPGCCSLDYVNV